MSNSVIPAFVTPVNLSLRRNPFIVRITVKLWLQSITKT